LGRRRCNSLSSGGKRKEKKTNIKRREEIHETTGGYGSERCPQGLTKQNQTIQRKGGPRAGPGRGRCNSLSSS